MSHAPIEIEPHQTCCSCRTGKPDLFTHTFIAKGYDRNSYIIIHPGYLEGSEENIVLVCLTTVHLEMFIKTISAGEHVVTES